jgi:hypothetical protein
MTHYPPKRDGQYCRGCHHNSITYNGNEEFICTNCNLTYEREWGEDQRGYKIPTNFLKLKEGDELKESKSLEDRIRNDNTTKSRRKS